MIKFLFFICYENIHLRFLFSFYDRKNKSALIGARYKGILNLCACMQHPERFQIDSLSIIAIDSEVCPPVRAVFLLPIYKP